MIIEASKILLNICAAFVLPCLNSDENLIMDTPEHELQR